MADPIYLDYLCAEKARELVEKLDGKRNPDAHVQKSMGILQEDGLYAFGVYQKYRDKEKECGGVLGTQIIGFLTSDHINPLLFPAGAPDTTDLDRVLRQLLGQPLAQIFLAKDLILRVLIYTYYHLRAEKKPEQD